MRSNLLGIWRNPATQKSSKTNRKQKDIQAEVQRGYTVARSVIEDGLKKYPEDWSLQLALASINHDENDYKAELAKDSKFSERRQKSFDDFKKACELYIASTEDIEQDEETVKPFATWWYASLGAVDLGRLDDKKQADLKQPAQIKEVIMSMPKQQAERHLDMFANTLFTRMSSIKPAVKYRYLKTGFEIVGDQKSAAEAQEVFEYYNDLVTEIKLETVVDGSDVVGQEPFGVFVNLVHTREIERESGGFQKYLQNQNNGNYYYNYGRPTENYRDKFEEIVAEALEEKFDILSVTFQAEDVNSRALEKYGWRTTPYAYLLLKARGPEVDQIAPVRLDLDFLDTSGYAVLPVESAIVPVDASSKPTTSRPVQNLKVTQTLDERQADEGKLILEVKATGQGLVPDLEEILDVSPDEFEIANIEDQGISISRFDPDSADNVVVSERTWMVTMNGKKDLAELPKTFQFASIKSKDLFATPSEDDFGGQ